MSYSTRGSGGGGGFGSFPYRSSHQQGSDNNNNHNNNSRRQRSTQKSAAQKRRERGGPLIHRASFSVSFNLIPLIVGKKGKTIQELNQRTKCLFDVPRKRRRGVPGVDVDEQVQDQELVQDQEQEQNVDNASLKGKVNVRASCVEYLLHGCWELSLIIKEDVDYCLHIHDVGLDLTGVLKYFQDCPGVNAAVAVLDGDIEQYHRYRYDGPFMVDSNDISMDLDSIVVVSSDERDVRDAMMKPCVSAYVLWIDASILDEDGVAVLVDNERFIDPGIQARVFSTLRIVNGDCKAKSLVSFIYGNEQEKPRDLYQKLFDKIGTLEKD